MPGSNGIKSLALKLLVLPVVLVFGLFRALLSLAGYFNFVRYDPDVF